MTNLLTTAKAIDKLLQQWIGDYGPVALAQIKEFRAAIADAEKQEPVAWIDPAFRNGREDRLIYIPRSDGTSVPLYLHPTAPTVPEGWQPIETAPKDNKVPLFLARFNEDGTMQSFDYDGILESDIESWEMPQVYYFWASANGSVEEPTHWMFQPEWFDRISAAPKPEEV